MKHVRIDEVIVARSDYLAAEPLPDGLPRKTYTEPIIVRDDMVLIDGLRRLWWHRDQGHEVAPAVVVSTFLGAMEQLGPQHVGRDITPLRLWNFMSVLDEYARFWVRGKSTGGWTFDAKGTRVRTTSIPGNSPRSPENSVRAHYLRSLNVSQHKLQSTSYLYRLAERGDKRARQLLDRVENGEIGIQQAARNYRAPNNLIGNVTDRAEQRLILDRGVAGLQAQVSALQKLGHPVVVSQEELASALQGMVKARSELTTFVSGLRKILKERETNSGK